MRRLLIPVLLCTAPLFAQEKPAPAQPKAAPAGRITGTILCDDTRKPARGAVVLLSKVPAADGSYADGDGGKDAITRVGLDGTYLAEHLPPGEYGLIVVFPAYLSGVEDIAMNDMTDASRATLAAMLKHNGTVVVRGSATQTLNATLVRGGAVSGRVLYSDGSPAAQMTLDVENVAHEVKPGSSFDENLNADRVMRAMFAQQSFATDDQGHYRITGLPSGKYRVAVLQSYGNGDPRGREQEMGMMFGAMADPGALRYYAGDTLHRKTAKTYDLRPGDEAAVMDITIPEHAFHHVSGRLLGKAGRNPNSGRLTLTDSADDTLIYQANSDEDGVFVFAAVPAGTYTLAAKEAAYTPEAPVPAPGKQFVPAAAVPFAPATQSVLVKDADVPDVLLSLTETAPKDDKPGAP